MAMDTFGAIAGGVTEGVSGAFLGYRTEDYLTN